MPLARPPLLPQAAVHLPEVMEEAAAVAARTVAMEKVTQSQRPARGLPTS
jgi:hypothetical protein